ncbi:prepilin-type N-terminal cleavage/methylation domain-containing protein [Thiohalobacter sp. COW1]|uniref:type IV pilus modification PilV family protein n=1 Tax=Thiohalobacter sp. COW1 TaxID=2795687 RepID=UPI0021022039|nr:prepilin-type N-terminal cleavage/methylation domain-containing protein [Thiohalobacter sp. COW1]
MRTRKKQSGISLMEALITLVILGIGLAGAAKFQAFALTGNREVKNRAEAVNLLREQAARLRHFATLQQYQALPAHGSRQHAGTLTTYHLDWQLTPAPGGDWKRLTLRVHWPTATGPRREAIQTLIAGHEPARSGWRLK